jgi:multicomponent Na+:H+ antiporter subunit C
MTEQWIYGVTGIVLFALGIRALLLQSSLLRRVLAINIMGAGVFMVLIATAYHGRAMLTDPVPHALVLTGIVVAVSATALALVIGRKLSELGGPDENHSDKNNNKKEKNER